LAGVEIVRWILAIGLIFSIVQISEAAKIYTWKDAAGITHFVDAAYKVPEAFRKTSGRDLEALPKTVKADGQKDILNGEFLYNSKCSTCHVIGSKSEGKREGLGGVVMDGATKYPRPTNELFDRLRSDLRTEGGMSDVEVTDEELMAITEYLIKESNP